MYKGSLKAGTQLQVSFSCAQTNNGTTAIVYMFMSDSNKPMPAPQMQFIAPGATLAKDFNVPKEAAACRITIDPPDGGKGTLTVKQGTQDWSNTLTGDDSWFFDVQP